MKITATFSLASIGLASAFVNTPHGAIKVSQGRLLPLHASKPLRDKNDVVNMEIRDIRDVVSDETKGADVLDTRVPPPKGFRNGTPMPMDETPSEPERKAPLKSQSLPFMKCPPTLDGTMAGDVGFDPVGFSDSFENLANYREAEVKHGRLAMLAAAGWPLSELFHTRIANLLDMEPVLDATGRAPSVLNGGLGNISPAYWIGCVGFAAALDVYGSFFASKKNGYTVGDWGFDPLGFYPHSRIQNPSTLKKQERMQHSEIKHGRLAMLAITAYAAQEFVSHTAVVDQVPYFFRPIWEVVMNQSAEFSYPTEAIGQATSAVVEATSAVPEIAAPAAVEASTVVPPVIESLSAAPVEAAAVVPSTPPAAINDEELVTAKQRIVELEAKLAQIQTLMR